jgi:hypothetical protein
MNWLRKWQAIVNKLYELCPWKSTVWMWLLEYEENIIQHKSRLLDKLYNITDEDFNKYFNF